MEYQNQQQQDIFSHGQRPLPNATTVLVLGILSIVVCFICGIIALSISSRDRRLYLDNPNLYSSSSYDLLKAGRICSIIGICITGLILVFYVFIIVFAIGIGTFGNS